MSEARIPRTTRDVGTEQDKGRCAPALGSEIEAGNTYHVRTSRFGSARVKILSFDAEWVTTEIVSGMLRGMNDDSGPGDEKTLRRSHCAFSPNTERSDSLGGCSLARLVGRSGPENK